MRYIHFIAIVSAVNALCFDVSISSAAPTECVYDSKTLTGKGCAENFKCSPSGRCETAFTVAEIEQAVAPVPNLPKGYGPHLYSTRATEQTCPHEQQASRLEPPLRKRTRSEEAEVADEGSIELLLPLLCLNVSVLARTHPMLAKTRPPRCVIHPYQQGVVDP